MGTNSQKESHNIDTGKKLPWRSLPDVLRDHGFRFQNWPESIKLSTQNGIEKAPQKHIIALHEALNDKERPLGICRITDGSGQPRMNVLMEDPSPRRGNKRNRDGLDEVTKRNIAIRRRT
jgi:hypothetical protein